MRRNKIMKKGKVKWAAMRSFLSIFLLTVFGYFAYRMYFALKFTGKAPPSHGQVGNVHFETNGTDTTCRTGQHTFTESKAFAKAKGGRLCTSDEMSGLLHKKKYLADELSYAAVQDGKKGKWVQVSQQNPGEVIDVGKAKWSENADLFQAENKVYPYWVGTVQAWCT